VRVFNSWISKIVLGAFLLFSIISANNILHGHYYNSWTHQNAIDVYNSKYDDITPYLRSLGIDRMDKVYCTPDPSINISLYLMDQKGFTDFFRTKELFSNKVELFRENGCKYVIIGDYNRIDVQPEEIGLEKIGSYNKVGIYKVN
jgi:hypothetical protein